MVAIKAPPSFPSLLPPSPQRGAYIVKIILDEREGFIRNSERHIFAEKRANHCNTVKGPKNAIDRFLY